MDRESDNKARSRRMLGSVTSVRLLAIGVVIAMAALAGCGSSGSSGGGSASGKGGTVTFAMETGLTGADAEVGGPQLDGFKLAVAQINAAGGISVGGAKYKIATTVSDDTSVASVGVEKVHGIIGSGAHFMFGLLSSDVVNAYLPLICNSKTLLAMSSGTVLPALTQCSNSFRTADPPQVLDTAVVNFIKSQGYPTFAVMNDDTYPSTPQSRAQEALIQHITHVVAYENYTAGSSSYTSQVSVIAPKHPAAMEPGEYADDAFRVVLESRQVGFAGDYVDASGPTAAEVQALGVTNADLKGFYDVGDPSTAAVVASPPGQFPATQVAAAKAFNSAYVAMFKSQPGLLSADAYTSVYLVAAAITAAKTTTDIPAIESALNAMKVSTVQNHLAQPVQSGPGGLLFTKHDTLPISTVSTWNGSNFVVSKIISDDPLPGICTGSFVQDCKTIGMPGY
jgi:ABC-type branched-subunit amino acid transport system substrate-binding protein